MYIAIKQKDGVFCDICGKVADARERGGHGLLCDHCLTVKRQHLEKTLFSLFGDENE